MATNYKELENPEMECSINGNNAENGKIATTKSKFDGAFVYFATMAATLNMLTAGLSTAYTSSASSTMTDPKTGLKDIGENEITWIASIPQITVIPGALISGYLSNTFGRQAFMMYNSVPFVISWLMIAYANSIPWIYIGCSITGYCAGSTYITVYAYLTEISVPHNRGRLGALASLSFSLGLFGAMSLGLIISWRWLAVFSAAVATASALLLFFAPESPNWLIAHGFRTEAYKALKRLRGNVEEAASEYESLCKTLCPNQNNPETPKCLALSEFTSSTVYSYKPLLLGCALYFFQSFSSITALRSYTEQIFENIGGSLDPKYSTLVIGCLELPTSILNSSIIERVKRRKMYMLSGTLISTGLTVVGLFIIVFKNSAANNYFGWMPLVGCISVFVGSSLGYGPLPHIMVGEMSPHYTRSTILGITISVAQLCSFIVNKTFNDLQHLISEPGVYFMFAVISFCGIIFGLLILPETKGKSLDDIQKYFVKT